MSSAKNIPLVLVKGEPLNTDDLRVLRPEEVALEAINSVIERAKAIKVVKTIQEQARASITGGELKGLMQGLKANYDAQKAPIIAIGRALDTLFKELNGPLDEQYKRMDQLVSVFQDGLRREKEMAEAKAREELRAIEEAAQAKIKDLERQVQEQQMRAKMAEDAAERAKAEKAKQKLEGKIQTEEIALQLEKENVPIANVGFPLPKPPGGSGFVRYDVTMTDVELVFKHHRDLLKIELRQGLAQELAKSLDQQGRPLQVAGLVIRKQNRTSFRGAAAIRIQGE